MPPVSPADSTVSHTASHTPILLPLNSLWVNLDPRLFNTAPTILQYLYQKYSVSIVTGGYIGYIGLFLVTSVTKCSF